MPYCHLACLLAVYHRKEFISIASCPKPLALTANITACEMPSNSSQWRESSRKHTTMILSVITAFWSEDQHFKPWLSEMLSGSQFQSSLVMNLEPQVTRTTVWGEENKRWKLFITRFFDCETCWHGGKPPVNASLCAASYKQHYEFAYCRFLR